MPPSRPLRPSERLTVLCVDDQDDALLVRKALLEHAGYVVLAASSAEEALPIFAANRIDAVVSDYFLRDATGTEMARRMKLAKPRVPIVLFSGLTDPPAGVEHTDEFISKTEGPEKLLDALADLTSNRKVNKPGAPFLVEQTTVAAPGKTDKCAATVAHEINNPLDSLLSLLYLADAEPSMSERGHHYLALAREEVARISQIAHSVLHEFRHDRGLEDTNVPQLLGSVMDLYRQRLESRGISVKTRCCPDGILAVYPGPLRQMFSNLLLNAADAMPTGGSLEVKISTAHEWTGQKRHGLRATFADNGCGISATNLHRIFKPFFTTKGPNGSGLGLSLVNDVVHDHGGSVRVRSSTRPGHSGSVFSIFLPAT